MYKSLIGVLVFVLLANFAPPVAKADPLNIDLMEALSYITNDELEEFLANVVEEWATEEGAKEAYQSGQSEWKKSDDVYLVLLVDVWGGFTFRFEYYLGNLDLTIDFDSMQMVATFTPIPELNFSYSVSEDVQDIFAPLTASNPENPTDQTTPDDPASNPAPQPPVSVNTINTYKTFQGIGYNTYFEEFFNSPTDKDLLLYVPGYSYLQGIIYANGNVKALGPIRVIGGIIENNPDKSIVLEKGAMLTTNPDYLKAHTNSSSVKLKITKWEEVE